MDPMDEMILPFTLGLLVPAVLAGVFAQKVKRRIGAVYGILVLLAGFVLFHNLPASLQAGPMPRRRAARTSAPGATSTSPAVPSAFVQAASRPSAAAPASAARLVIGVMMVSMAVRQPGQPRRRGISGWRRGFPASG